jgi:hypothetical protein
MLTDNLLAVLVLTILLYSAIGLLTVYILRKSDSVAQKKYSEPHPLGYWVSILLSIGAGLGIALGTAFHNIALGTALGSSLGVISGGTWERLNSKKLRQPTLKEKVFYRWAVILGWVMMMAGVSGFMFLRY